MATSSNALFTSSRRSQSLGLWVAGGILFVIGFGGSSAVLGAYTGALSQVAASGVRVKA
jgi:hypothetical protein